MEAFETIKKISAQLKDLSGAASLLGWDQEVYMPAGAIERRATQLGTLAALRHRILAEELAPLLPRVETASLNEKERLNLAQLRLQTQKALKLPAAFVQAQAELAARTQYAWEQAKKQASWQAFCPALEQMVDSKRREAEYYGYTNSPYEALMDSYEPGLTLAEVDPIFEQLLAGLVPLLKSLQGQPQVPDAFLATPVGKDAQWALSMRLLAEMGFDLQHGRQDLSTHPFTTSAGPEDVRLTTLIVERDMQAMLYSTLHEMGHGLYEQGLPAHAYGLPEGEASSLSLHESQSRLWENNIGRSQAFCQWLFPLLAEYMPHALAGKTPEDLYRAVNKVQPGPIRIQADELTYHTHILLRYQVERQLIEGRLAVRDIPDYWSAFLLQHLGIQPTTEADGPLQDIHWAIGAIGYFPTYTLGSLYAAQQYAHMAQQLPELQAQLRTGHFAPIHAWLRQRVHQYGSLYSAREWSLQVLGEPLDPRYFLRYLSDKLVQVYALPIA
ncbi:MAG: carboxypeptidase M32 [Bacteroidetes bacterium]|nr:carboxypeptidase M32 [Bacteroidota bacterium]